MSRRRLLCGACLAGCVACNGIARLDELTFSDSAGGAGGVDGQGVGGNGAADSTSPGSGGGSAGGQGGAGMSGNGGTGATTITIEPGLALVGDGFLASPDLCGAQVIDTYSQASYEAIHVGRDVPCSGIVTYRAYMRFSVAALGGEPVINAMLRFYYAQNTAATAGVSLYYMNDFGQLDASDWSLSPRQDLGTVFNASTIPGWIEVDVTAVVGNVQTLGENAVAFKLQYQNEGENPGGTSRWYGIISTDNGSDGPELVVTY